MARVFEMLRSGIPSMLDSSAGVSKDDKMLLNCMEHVSRVRVCHLIWTARLTFFLFHSDVRSIEGSYNR
jgi:hypothetical protein